MSFSASTYINFVSTSSTAQTRLFLQYMGPRNDFDIVIIGSGIGGGVLADDLADRLGKQKRMLILEAGSFIYPTHVYNICRFSNASMAWSGRQRFRLGNRASRGGHPPHAIPIEVGWSL